MGIDLARICDHNMHFSNQEEFVASLSRGFNCKVFPTYIEDSELKKTENILYLDDSEGHTVQHYIDTRDLISMFKMPTKNPDSLYINSHCLDLLFDEYYIGRWFTVRHMADHIRENGFPDQSFYTSEDQDFPFINRRKYYDFIKTMGGTQSVIFCSDYHDEWLDLFAENYTIDDFIAWGKKDFIFVEFKDLIHFDFPTNTPDYCNVFIHDTFEDLKNL